MKVRHLLLASLVVVPSLAFAEEHPTLQPIGTKAAENAAKAAAPTEAKQQAENAQAEAGKAVKSAKDKTKKKAVDSALEMLH